MVGPSSSTNSLPPTPRARPRRLARLACFCGIALVALASLPKAEAAHLVAAGNDDLPQGVQWATGDELSAMTSSWVAGVGGRKSKRAAASPSEDDQTTTRSTSTSRRAVATARTTAVKEAETSAVRMAASAASISSVEGEASTPEGSSGGVRAVGLACTCAEWIASSRDFDTESTRPDFQVATTTITKTASATSALATSTAVPKGYQLPEAFDTTIGYVREARRYQHAADGLLLCSSLPPLPRRSTLSACLSLCLPLSLCLWLSASVLSDGLHSEL